MNIDDHRKKMQNLGFLLQIRGLFCGLLIAVVLSGCTSNPAPYSLDQAQIEADTRYLTETFGPRETGTEVEIDVCNWLEDVLIHMGFSYEKNTLLRNSFDGLNDQQSENLTAVYRPDPTLPLVTIVAHYDSVSTSPGAGDNAVAVAILLEISRYLAENTEQFDCQIDLVFLGSEENGYFGSHHYVQTLSPADRQRQIGTFNMDISAALLDTEAQLVCTTLGGVVEGTYVEGNFLAPMDNAVSRSIATAYERLYDADLFGGTLHTGESDHISFHEVGMDAANVCWRVVEDGLPVLPDTYHKAGDTPDTLDYESAVITGRCVLGGIEALLE